MTPANDIAMPVQRRQRTVSPSSATDIRVVNGTPSWLAIATADTFCAIDRPANSSAKLAAPDSSAATTIAFILPGTTRRNGNSSAASTREAQRREQHRRHLRQADLADDEVQAPDQRDHEQRGEVPRGDRRHPQRSRTRR